jgi:NitT/TauT family transport system substrate-binding protein
MCEFAMQHLEYGVPSDKVGLDIRFGIEKGFFAQESIDLAVRVVFGGPEIAAQYESGELKIGEIGTPPATTAIAQGATFKIVGSGVRRRALQYFVVRPEISDWPDLKGKSVGALSKGSCSYWFARLVLDSHGVNPDTEAHLIGLGSKYADVVSLLKRGELHGAVISEPNISMGETAGALRVMKALTEPDYCPTMQWMVVVANRDFLANSSDLVAAILRASRRSYHYVAKHPKEFADFCAAYLKTDAATILTSIERERGDMHYDCEVDMDGLDLAIELQRRLGAFDRPIRAADLVDLRHVPQPTTMLA